MEKTTKKNSKFIKDWEVLELQKLDGTGAFEELVVQNEIQNLEDGVEKMSTPNLYIQQAIGRIKRLHEVAIQEACFYRNAIKTSWKLMILAAFLGGVFALFNDQKMIQFLYFLKNSRAGRMGVLGLIVQGFINPWTCGFHLQVGKKMLKENTETFEKRVERLKDLIVREKLKQEEEEQELEKEEKEVEQDTLDEGVLLQKAEAEVKAKAKAEQEKEEKKEKEKK